MLMNKELTGIRVAIVLTNDFEQVEMTDTRFALEKAGAKTFLIAPEIGTVQGMKHDLKADTFPVDMALADADPDEFDALLLPGGALNADSLRMNAFAQLFLKTFMDANKPVAAICHAPWLLISSGVTKNRTLTSFYTIQDDIINAGGNWEDKETVKDHNLLTSRTPDDIPAFNREMIKLFSQQHIKQHQMSHQYTSHTL